MKMSDIKTNEIIGFHLVTDPHGCFSNWYESEFRYAGAWYNCVEQYMMAQKVSLGRRYDLRDMIMKSNDPDEIKKLAGKDYFPEFMKIKDIWDKNCKHIVKRGVRAKFQQNPDMLKELLETGNALLCECAGQDKVWGIGINLNNPAWKDVANWKGNNYLGIILMEVREELRREIAEYGSVQYIDYLGAGTIDEWKVTARQLKRIPQYYAAIHTYADQLPVGHMRDSFYDCPLDRIEYSMCVNMGGGLPVIGFYEMKQEVYEIAHKLSCKSYVSDIFRGSMPQWGSRGNPYFWDDLQTVFSFKSIPISSEELISIIHEVFYRITGERLVEDAVCYVDSYAHGGMSSGQVTGEWIINTCIPMLQERLENINR